MEPSTLGDSPSSNAEIASRCCLAVHAVVVAPSGLPVPARRAQRARSRQGELRVTCATAMVRRDASNPGLESSSDAGPLPDDGSLRGTAGPLEELVATTYADVWRLCWRIGRRGCCTMTSRRRRSFAPPRALQRFRGRASRRTWIFAIARHVCMDELRRRHRRRRRDERLAAARDEPDAADLSAEVTARELLGQLDSDRRDAFVLTQMFRLSMRRRRPSAAARQARSARVSRGRGTS